MNLAAPVASAERTRNGYAWPLLFGLLWILVWYRDTATAMVDIWARSETFTHGFVVPPIALWLIWRQRHRLAKLTPYPTPWILWLVAGAGLAWLLGELAVMNALTQLAFVVLLVLTAPAILGLPIARTLAFPLGFLFFAVPIGEFVMPQLMEWTANFTVLALRLTGIPVYREGLQFVIPSGHWSVVEACSGVRYLIASLMVGVLFAYLTYTSLRRRLIFIGVSAVVPIVANWLRAYMIVMLGHLSGNRLAAGVDHLIYGWLFFGVVIMLMFIIGARWAENPPPESTPALSSSSARPIGSGPFWIVAAMLAALTAAPHLANRLIAEGNTAVAPRLPDVLKDLAGGWRQTPVGFSDWQPHFVNPSADLKLGFANGEHSVGLYVAYYRNQDYDRKLVSSTNVMVPSQDHAWTQLGRGTQILNLDGQTVALRTAELRGNTTSARQGNETRLVAWQTYWIGGHLTASDHLAKLYTVLSRLLGQGDDSAVIVLYAPIDQPGGGESALETFAHANLASIEAMLRATRERR